MTSPLPQMPVMAAPQPAGMLFLVGTCVIMGALLAWWAVGGERRQRGWIMPLVFAGNAVSAMMIEPIYDNTLLYWYPDENRLAILRGFGRTIPWYVPLGYAWFFGGSAYLVWRVIATGASARRLWQVFGAMVVVDWLAISICQWFDLSAFYGRQPFQWIGSPIWFSFCDATGGFVLGAALVALAPHLQGGRRLWLLLLPSFTYGATLGATTAPVSLALNSGWPSAMIWAGGAATMMMCLIAIHVIARTAQARSGGR